MAREMMVTVTRTLVLETQLVVEAENIKEAQEKAEATVRADEPQDWDVVVNSPVRAYHVAPVRAEDDPSDMDLAAACSD